MDVLVADDDDDLREMVLLVLEDAGYEAAGIAEAAALVETAWAARPTLVLLDLSMPGLVDVASIVGALRRLPVAPAIVALSGRCDAEATASGLSLDGLLLKPFASGALIAEVGRYCSRRGRDDSGARPQRPEL